MLANYDELKNNYEDLRDKYVARNEELTKLRRDHGEWHRASSSGTVAGMSKYEEIVGPVIEEYEKTISAMEAELSLNRAALRLTNDLVEEKEDELNQTMERKTAGELYIEELRTRLERVARAVELQQENRLLREQLRTRPGFGGLIGVSMKMQRVYKMIEKVSQHEYPVLVLGESGTGKELVARSIHFSGPRKDRPFAPVDCSALVPTLIESELFGYVKGAFTGAVQAKQGLLEAAQGGTLFLDEIGDMPVDLQAKLLRALQEREVKPVGSTERRHINVRIIAATNRDLETAIRSGAFRQDLYFRLNVVQVKLPPLRDRKSDIPILVTAFLEKFSDPQGPVRTISEDAMRRLIAYDWPGNVRELENAIERAVALGSGPILHVGDLPSNLQYPTTERTPEKDEILPLEELERRAILRTLRETGGDKLSAARMLGIGKTTLYRKLKQYHMEHAEQ